MAWQQIWKGFCLWFFKETQERKKLMSCQALYVHMLVIAGSTFVLLDSFLPWLTFGSSKICLVVVEAIYIFVLPITLWVLLWTPILGYNGLGFDDKWTPSRLQAQKHATTYNMPMCTLNLWSLKFFNVFTLSMFFFLVLWLDNTHCVLVVGVGHDLFLSTQISRYCLVFMPLHEDATIWIAPQLLSSNIFIAYETLTMAPLWLHVMWLVVGRIIFNPCVNLPPRKVTACQWNTCDLFKSFKFSYKIFWCQFNKKTNGGFGSKLVTTKVNKTHAYESK